MKNFKQKNNSKGITLIALVITIIVLLILAAVSIATLTGENGILTKANDAKVATEKADAEEKVQVEVAASFDDNGKFNKETFKKRIESKDVGGKVLSDDGDKIVVEVDGYEITVNAKTGKEEKIIKSESKEEEKNPIKVPELWEATTADDSNWYDYGGVNINPPKLVGKMTPIKYTGDIGTDNTNKWANAITADGSMWVWIPRYAYKITSGYHSTTAGTIEIKFINGTGNTPFESISETILTDPSKVTYKIDSTGMSADDIQNEFLVHPAFTGVPANGGWEEDVTGIWVAKFEPTDVSEKQDKSKMTIKPGETSLTSMTINEQYQLAKSSTFGESLTAEGLGSHMAKNSEWGAVAYLTHSEYGIGQNNEVDLNTSDSYITGGTNIKTTIYGTNAKQSTTYNAYGVYDINGGAEEFVASYSYNKGDNLEKYGGTTTGDLYGPIGDERSRSTKYKTVYEGNGSSQTRDYEKAAKFKGDAVWETSNGQSLSSSWFGEISLFPVDHSSFFSRGGLAPYDFSGCFCYQFRNRYCC